MEDGDRMTRAAGLSDNERYSQSDRGDKQIEEYICENLIGGAKETALEFVAFLSPLLR